MNDWQTIITVLVTLIGLFFTIGKPIINLNTAITKLQVTVDNLMKEVNEFKSKNSETHNEIYDKLDDHETRITRLEVRNE